MCPKCKSKLIIAIQGCGPVIVCSNKTDCDYTETAPLGLQAAYWKWEALQLRQELKQLRKESSKWPNGHLLYKPV
jgi:ssDNA-binding Zn-finger/Zn-ribbon topoisomerase 1